MNRIALSLFLSAFAFVANAETPAPDVAVQVQNEPAGVTVVTGDTAQAKQTNDRYCLRETGSHVGSKHRKPCVSANGTSYSREDIERTGAIDLADALRRLDTSVQISHN